VLTVLALVPLAGVAWFNYRSPASAAAHEVKLQNPLQLRAALVFGLLLSLFFVGGRALEQTLGDPGLYAMAAIAGLVDVDAISLSLAEAAARDLDVTTAQRGIVIALLVNTAVKAALAAVLGGVAMLRSATAVLAIALLGGVMAAVLTLG
jgi:uncharacterized membrane protein (DUF4010 family)